MGLGSRRVILCALIVLPPCPQHRGVFIGFLLVLLIPVMLALILLVCWSGLWGDPPPHSDPIFSATLAGVASLFSYVLFVRLFGIVFGRLWEGP